MTLATRLRALWLVCLLVLAPVGPLGLVLSGHATGEDTHVTSPLHDASAHGIAVTPGPAFCVDPGRTPNAFAYRSA